MQQPKQSRDLESTRDERAEGWVSLRTFGLYRILLIVLLVSGLWGFGGWWMLGTEDPGVANLTVIFYFVAATVFLWFVRLRRPGVEIQLTAQVMVDAAVVVLMMHTSGGLRSGLGILLLVPIVASGLILRGRMVYFHAAVATIALLVEQAVQLAGPSGSVGELFQAGLLSVGFFAVAAATSTLARYARGAESIAEARGVDLANLAQINELVIRDMQDGFLVVDETGAIRQCNPQCETMLGRMAEAQPLADYAPELYRQWEVWRHDPDAAMTPLRAAASRSEYQPRFLAIGAAAGLSPAPTVIFLEDTGRIREKAQQLKLAALGRLTASIAHEIRNPLSSINHATELLLEDEARTDGDARLLKIIRDNAHRLDRMVQEVLYLNRRDRAQPEAIDLTAYLSRFAQEFAGNEKVPRHAFVFEIDDLRRVAFDKTHLDQILWNLARNAWRHGRKLPGSIRLVVRAAASADHLNIDVCDDGPGVAPAATSHLFEPFFTTDAQGTGLGLYIARELADVNGARLEHVPHVDGAVFRLRVRVADVMETA
ncbi:MAG: PAS domain-containing sensor histidine kinase [Betaproteobacteria bacterium]|nr:PAS domain-containing sensor histidine kinase [Betaproteobacteria bacterium]